MKYIKPIAAVILLTIIDQITKYLAVANLYLKPDFTVRDGIFSFTYHQNAGAAFGMFQGGRWLFLVFAIVVVCAIGYYYIQLPEGEVYSWVRLCLVFVLAGAIGNSIDRLVNGYVVDFLRADFINFPIFNVADMYVVTGTILLGILVLFFMKEETPSKVESAEKNHEQ